MTEKTEEQIGELVARYVKLKDECERLSKKLAELRGTRNELATYTHGVIRNHFGKDFQSADAAVDAWQWGIGR